MTTEKRRDPVEEDECQPGTDPDPNCDPKLVDEVACEASGVAAQAAYNSTYAEAMTTAKTDYDTARKDYRAKRHDLALQVQDLKHQIRHLIERIKCLIVQERVWRCLDDAYGEIVEELRCCETPDGCCVDECEYDLEEAGQWDHQELAKRIAKYQEKADAAKKCFDSLVGAPAALQTSFDAAKAEVDAVNTALSADPATTDLKLVYAQALVANRNLERIWGGFERTHDFSDCICRALTCWTKGCAAVSILSGALAVVECKEKAESDRCERLKSNTVHEILAVYDRICSHKPCHEDGDHGADDDDECHERGGRDTYRSEQEA